MKVSILKPIKISEVGREVLPSGIEVELSDSTAKVLIAKGFVKSVEKEVVKASPKRKPKKDK